MNRKGIATYCLFLVVMTLTSCSNSIPGSNRFPEIKDPDKLVLDCEFMLVPSTPDGLIPPEKWRESVRDLKPVSVKREGTVIEITTFQGEGLDSRGFHVHPLSEAKVINGEVQPRLAHWKEIDLYPGIYRFEYIP